MLPLTAITERRIKVRPGAAIWGRALQICRGKFFPTTGGSKIVQPEQGSAVANDVATAPWSEGYGQDHAPSLEMLILLSERFHKSVDWILRGEGH